MNKFLILMNNSNFELVNSQEYVDFRSKYKKFVFDMNSQEFAHMMLREGGEQTRINIIYQMYMCGCIIPSKLLYMVLDRKLNPVPNYIKLYWDENLNENLNENGSYLNKFEPTQKDYCKFKMFIKNNFPHLQNFPPYITFKKYFLDIDEIEVNIKNLSQSDCNFMKIAHII